MVFRPVRDMDVKAGTGTDAWSADIDFAWQTRLMSLECWDENLNVQLSNDGGTTFGDPFEVDKDRPLVIPFAARTMQVQNKTPGSNSRYQVAGMD